jgi:TRAP-type C4-dicarboxylate transport system permease small subunit
MTVLKRTLDGVLTVICVALFAMLVLTVAWHVFSRQVLDNASTWSEELARYEFVWLGLFASALVSPSAGTSQSTSSSASSRRKPSEWLPSGPARHHRLRRRRSRLGRLGVMYLVIPVTGLIITFYAVYHLMAIQRREEAAIGFPEVDEAI